MERNAATAGATPSLAGRSRGLRPRTGTLEAARAVAGGVALTVLLLAGALIALESAARRTTLVPSSRNDFPGWLAGPLPGVGDGLSEPRFCVLLLVMCGSYLAVLALARSVRASWAIGAVVLLHLLMTLAPPLLSADVFGYIDWARLGAVHGLDPYANGPAAVPDDPAYAYMRWATELGSPYGPLFTLMTYAFAPFGVAASLWSLKLLTGVASLGCVALVWACARRLEVAPLPAILFVGLNPVLLVFEVAGAHNDMFFVVLMLAGLLLTLRAKDAAASGAVMAGAAVKASGGLLIPFVVIAARDRRAALKGAAVSLLAIGVAVVIGFGTNITGLVKTILSQQEHVALLSVPNALSRWAGLGGMTAGVRAVSITIFLAVLAWTLLRAARDREWVRPAGWATFALLLTTAWLLPWYVVWLLPLAALGKDRRLQLGALALCAFVIGARVPIWLSMPS